MLHEKRVKLPNKIDITPAAQRQKTYLASLNITCPEHANKSDAAALIARALDEDQPAAAELIAYARQKGMQCSDYVGNKFLHNLLFDNLNTADKTTFFCFCVYKFHHPEVPLDLLLHEDGIKFIKFGEDYEKDGYFQSSLEEYEGEELVYFGKSVQILPDGKKKTVYGGSIYTRAYKVALSFIKDNIY